MQLLNMVNSKICNSCADFHILYFCKFVGFSLKIPKNLLFINFHSGFNDIIHILLEYGADVNAREKDYARTPLFLAAIEGLKLFSVP